MENRQNIIKTIWFIFYLKNIYILKEFLYSTYL